MKLTYLIFFSLVFLFTEVAYPNADSLLVEIGSSGISVDEFKQRFELIPQIALDGKKDIEQKKNNMLYSLIAEKLWAQEAELLKLDTSSIMQITFQTIEKMFVRDALYKIEITDKVKISNEERIEGIRKIYNDLHVEPLKFNDSVSAYRAYQLLQSGIPFDSVKAILQSDIPPIQIKFGELRNDAEDILFKLNEGEYSLPIKSSSGWLIFRLLKKEPVPFENRDKALMNAEEIIKQRKIEKYYDEFFGKFFGGRKIETEGPLFWSISDKITERLSYKKISQSIPDSENVYLDVNDLLIIENQLGRDTLNMNFIKLDEAPISVIQFLREFIFEGFYSANLKPNVIAAKMNSRVKSFIEMELLAREGYKRGLQNLSEVKSSISMWKDNYLAKILKNMLLDSVKVTDDEAYEYYLKQISGGSNSIMQVNILEILTDSLTVIESVLNDLARGSDFRQLASLHTKRVWTKNNGGEFGFFPVTMYGEIGRIAATMQVGEIYGPVKLPEGYSIFKLIEKNESKFDSTISFEQSKDEIKKNLAYEKSANFFIDYTVKLANKYGVSINEQLFNSIEILDMNLFVYRYMGFGGRINAVPMVLPFTEWFLPWKESNKPTP